MRFAFAYPVHWRDEHGGALFDEFRELVRGCFPEAMHPHLRFVAEPEGAILSLKHQGLLDSQRAAGVTLIVDVGGSSTDIVAGQLDPRRGELLILGRYGQPFGGGLYDAALAAYLTAEMSVPAAALADDPSALTTLRIFGKRLKEALSRALLQNSQGGAAKAQRTLTLVLHGGEIYRRLIKLDQETFENVAGGLDEHFKSLMAQSLSALNLDASDIGQVALVGGGAQLYSIVRHLRERFGDEKVVLADNPDEMVARGAALEYGAQMGMIQPGASLVLQTPSRVDPAHEADTSSGAAWRLVSPGGQDFLLDEGITKVGRARAAHIWLDSEKVSRAHAEIHLSGDPLTVTDLGSTNGTFVNGARIQANQAHLLKPGDEIRFGDRTFRIERG